MKKPKNLNKDIGSKILESRDKWTGKRMNNGMTSNSLFWAVYDMMEDGWWNET